MILSISNHIDLRSDDRRQHQLDGMNSLSSCFALKHYPVSISGCYPANSHGDKPPSYSYEARFSGLGGLSRLRRRSRGVHPTAGNDNRLSRFARAILHPSSPSRRSTSRPRGVVFGYGYIVPLWRDFSRQKITHHIRPASEIQNRV